MERRKFMIGIGSLAAGSAAATGTGAFSSMSASRGASVNVVNDANGLIALKDTSPDGGAVRTKSNGELEINFAPDEDSGVNINSTYQAGALFNVPGDLTENVQGNSPTNGPAFKIVNNDTAGHTIGLEYTLDSDEGHLNEDGSKLVLQARPAADGLPADESGNTPETIRGFTVEHGNTSPSLQYQKPLQPGKFIGISVLVDTTGEGASTDESLSGTLKLTSSEQ